MSMLGALSNAQSGLNAAARSAEVVSSNIANALTDGYGRRELDLSSRVLGNGGSGVTVDGVTRNVDQLIISDRRIADAALGDSSTRLDYLRRLERVVGAPGSVGSLSDRMAGFNSALIEGASRPDSESRLRNILSATQSLATHINTISSEIQNERMQADKSIEQQISQLNDSLKKVEQINHQVLVQQSSGHNSAALLDQRQQLIDTISSIIPVKSIPRENGQIALISTKGAILLDGRAADFGFNSVGVITPDMTLSAGSLSGLTINGVSVGTSSDQSIIAGGSLSALFEIRDDMTITAQENLDAVARDLVERFQDPGVDATLGVLDAGLFTDLGAHFDSANEEGLAARLKINFRVNPDTGGELWRLRDGIGAVTPGETGNASLLQNLSAALTTTRVPVSGGFIGSARTASGLSGDFLSIIGTERQIAETEKAFASSSVDSLKTQELQDGVDTDQELQQLLLVEQAYAANARVIQTIDDLIKTLLGI